MNNDRPQTIFRIKKQDNFVTIDTHALRNESLSWQAKGLHSYLMQLPNDWQINEADLSNRSKSRWRATKTALLELIVAGYVWRQQKYDTRHRFSGYLYIVTEKPELLPLYQNALTENPLTENGMQVNINVTKDLSNQVLNNNNARFANAKACVSLYFKEYKNKTGNDHPTLKAEQLNYVLDCLAANEEAWNFDADDWETVVKAHFSRKLKTDWNINHFVSGMVIEHLMYQNCYYGEREAPEPAVKGEA